MFSNIRLSHVLVAVLLLLLTACGGPSVPLQGTVTDAYTNNPVAGATVKLGRAQATSDASGNYQLDRWNAKGTLQIDAAGYETAMIDLTQQPQLAKPEPPAARLDATIRPNTVSGVVSDRYSGSPLVGAQVKASDTISTTTGADGRYTLAGVPEGFDLTLSATGYDQRTESLDRTTQFDADLRPNVLAGKVTERDGGKPVANATVKAGDATATTGDDGSYQLPGVPEGATIEISAEGYALAREPVPQAATLDVALQSNVLSGRVTDGYTGEPVARATVRAGNSNGTTGDDGSYRLEVEPGRLTVEVVASGYATATETLQQLEPLDIALRPDVLKSTVVDGQTNEPIRNATIIATETITGTAVAFTRIDNSSDGAFSLDGIPEQGYVQVLAPGYLKASVELKPGAVPSAIKLEPFVVKAAYITAAVASAGDELLGEYFDLIERTELNSLVIDLKSDLRDDLGLVYYDSQAPMVRELETSAPYVDMAAVVAEAKQRGIYTIARIQLFSHDNVLADARPEWAIQERATGKVYADYPGPGIRYAYLDPTNRNVWQYNIELAIEAAQLGFDEVNFDYIRFPDLADEASMATKLRFSQPVDPINDPAGMYDTIASFSEEAHRAVNGAGAYMSVDVFGRVVLGRSLTIAQDIERMAPHSDYIAPMPYPSLWWPGYLDFDNPTAHPYEVIMGSLKSAVPFFEGKRALLRPWLQDHTDPWQGSRVIEYGPKEVRAQIDATEQSGTSAGWMLYDSANTYTEGALKPER